MKKIYIIRKFVVASSLSDAIRKEKKVAPDDVYLDDFSIKNYKEELYGKES